MSPNYCAGEGSSRFSFFGLIRLGGSFDRLPKYQIDQGLKDTALKRLKQTGSKQMV